PFTFHVVQNVWQSFLSILLTIFIAKSELGQSVDARYHPMTLVIKRDFFRQLLHKHRPLGTRPNESHIAFQHIENLRQLINPDFSNKRSNASHAGVVLLSPDRLASLFCINAHAAELNDIKALAIEADSLLLIENRRS